MPVPVHDAPVRVSGLFHARDVALGVCVCLTLILCAAAGLIAAAVTFMRAEPELCSGVAGFVALQGI